MNANLKLIIKLIGVVGLIWGFGWLMYESINLYSYFTPNAFQNMLIVIMSATWLIILLVKVDDKPETKYITVNNPQEPKTHNPHKNIKKKTKTKGVNVRKLIEERLKED